MTPQKIDRLKKKAQHNMVKALNEMGCPLCKGIDNFIWTAHSLGKVKFEMASLEPLRCGQGHSLSVLGSNSEEVFLISVMDVHKRPLGKKVV